MTSEKIIRCLPLWQRRVYRSPSDGFRYRRALQLFLLPDARSSGSVSCAAVGY